MFSVLYFEHFNTYAMGYLKFETQYEFSCIK